MKNRRMKKRKISRSEKITNQLALIEDINKDIESSKKVGSKLMIRQYEHLKKQYVNNLYKMLAENYQIPIPLLAKEAA